MVLAISLLRDGLRSTSPCRQRPSAGSMDVQTDTKRTAAALTNAVLRVALCLDLNSRVLANVIGVSEGTMSRMRTGHVTLRYRSKPFELGLLLVRLYQALDAMSGGDDSVACYWLKNANTVLRERPMLLIQSVTGLVNVVQYLDTHRDGR